MPAQKATSNADSRTMAVLLVAVLVLLIASGTMIVRAVKQRNWQQAQLAQAQASDNGRDIRKPMRSLDQMQNYYSSHVQQTLIQINDELTHGTITISERNRRAALAHRVVTSAIDRTAKSNYTIPFDAQEVSHDLQQVIHQGTAPDR